MQTTTTPPPDDAVATAADFEAAEPLDLAGHAGTDAYAPFVKRVPSRRETDKAAAVAWARELMDADPRSWLLLDTETTGLLNDDPEIVQIGLLWPNGDVALDALVQPDWNHLTGGIPDAATAIHGIGDVHVRDCAPTFGNIMPVLAEIMHGRRVVVYNKDYDYQVLFGVLDRFGWDLADGFAQDWLAESTWDCAMKQYAAYVGEPGRYGDYKWQRLPDIGGGPAHSAIGDCRSTLELIKRMAAD